MRDLNDLFYFAAVVTHHGFAPASRALGVPKSNLSRRVARLEDRLGVRLIERSTRRFAVTEVGQEFYRHCQAVIAEADSAEEVAERRRSEPRGLVRASIPVEVARSALAEILPRFLEAYPLVRLQLTVTNRRIDLIEEGIDVAIRVRTRLDTDAALKMRVLGRERVLLVASPDFIGRHGAPTAPADLKALPTLYHDDGLGRAAWELTTADGRAETVELEPRLAASDFNPLLQAAIAGAGIAFLPAMLCKEALAARRLVHLLPEWSELQGIVHLVFTTRRGQLPAVGAFIDFLAENLPGAFGLKG
jgi:DNA-binding transcriptional LysR family regulator